MDLRLSGGSMLLELPEELQVAIVNFLPAATKRRLLLVNRCFRRITSQCFTMLRLSRPIRACYFGNPRQLAEQYLNIERLAILDSGCLAAWDETRQLLVNNSNLVGRLTRLSFEQQKRCSWNHEGPQIERVVEVIKVTSPSRLQCLDLCITDLKNAGALMDILPTMSCHTNIDIPAWIDKQQSAAVASFILRTCTMRLPHLTGLSMACQTHIADLAALMHLHGLRHLSISDIPLRQLPALTAACRQLSHLSTLCINPSHTIGEDVLPAQLLGLHHLTQLQQLFLGICIQGSAEYVDWGPAVGQLTNLRAIRTCAAQQLTSLQHLTQLELWWPDKSKLDLSTLSSLTGLRSLDLGCCVRGEMPANFPGVLRQLTHLKVVTAEGLRAEGLRGMSSLRHLQWSHGESCNHAVLCVLASLPSLQHLEISGVVLEAEDPPLPAFPRLESIACKLMRMSDAQLLSLCHAYSSVADLRLEFSVGCDAIVASSAGIGKAMQVFTNLETVTLRGGLLGHDELLVAIQALTGSNRTISAWHLSYMKDLRLPHILTLMTSCPHLEKLTLEGRTTVPIEQIRLLAAQKLPYLDLELHVTYLAGSWPSYCL